ncbi:SCO7613 C-terminal domain-containing membrane protein [Geodermatophilus sp. SYSU D00758]
MGAAPPPPLPYRARPPQLLLVVGAVLVVSGGGAATALTGSSARVLLVALAAAAAGVSAWGSSARLRGTEEVLAAAAVCLAVLATDPGGSLLEGPVAPPAVLTAVFLLLAGPLRRPVAWPLAAWATLQLTVLRALDGLDAGPDRTAAAVVVVLAGLGTCLAGRRLLARVALVTSAPWWVAAVTGGIATAWDGPASDRWAAAALTTVAALALLPARLEPDVDRLLGPPRLAPALAGVLPGAALFGVMSWLGPDAVMLTGYVGVLLASAAAALLTGWWAGLLLPLALGAGGTLVLLGVVQLAAGARWAELTLLLLLTAVPSGLVAGVRSDERASAVPTAVGCVGAAALVAIPAGWLAPAGAAVVLGALYAATLGAGVTIRPDSRRPTLVSGALCAAAAVVLLVAAGDRGPLAGQLFAQGLLTCGWAAYVWWSGPSDQLPAAPPAWRVGSAQLVVATWVVVPLAGGTVLEAWTLPLAAGLLLAQGPRLAGGPSWPTWGPGLLVAAVPSAVWAVVAPGSTRSVLLVTVAAAGMWLGARLRVRALLVTAAGTALAVAAGVAVVELPLPVAGALVVGVALLALGAGRERRPVDGWARRLADLR